MKLVPNEKELKIIERASDITDVDYGDIELEDLFIIIQDLVVEYNKLQEQLEDEIQDKEENYEQKKVDYYINYGLSERDFH